MKYRVWVYESNVFSMVVEADSEEEAVEIATDDAMSDHWEMVRADAEYDARLDADAVLGDRRTEGE